MARPSPPSAAASCSGHLVDEHRADGRHRRRRHDRLGERARHPASRAATPAGTGRGPRCRRPPGWISKWRWGGVVIAWPVLPTKPITWPARTRAPSSATRRVRREVRVVERVAAVIGEPQAVPAEGVHADPRERAVGDGDHRGPAVGEEVVAVVPPGARPGRAVVVGERRPARHREHVAGVRGDGHRRGRPARQPERGRRRERRRGDRRPRPGRPAGGGRRPGAPWW